MWLSEQSQREQHRLKQLHLVCTRTEANSLFAAYVVHNQELLGLHDMQGEWQKMLTDNAAALQTSSQSRTSIGLGQSSIQGSSKHVPVL